MDKFNVGDRVKLKNGSNSQTMEVKGLFQDDDGTEKVWCEWTDQNKHLAEGKFRSDELQKVKD